MRTMRSCCAHLVIIVVFHLSFFLCPLTHGQTAPPNDMVTNAILISGASVSVTGSNVGATRESWETSHTYRGAKTVWWRWTAPATGKVIVDTKGSDFDTRLNVYSGQIYPQGSVTQDLSTMDDDGTNLTSLCGFNAYTNVSYFIAVDGFVLGSNPPETAASGSIVLNLKMGLPAPVFTEEPQSRVVLPGSNVTFRAAVRTSGSFSTSYYPQWLRGGIPIPGATSLSLTITNAQIADADTYSIVVTNSTGTVTRADADLVVADLFITKQPRSQRVALGYSAAFTVEALSASTGLSYQWQKDGKDLPGATGSSYSISCVQEGDFGEYCAVVSSTTSSVTTSNALLSVSYPLTIGTFAGRARARGHADGSIFTARFDWPTGIARDGAGNFYVSDYIGQTIRKITPEGIVTTLAGLAGVAGTNDGLGVAARFRNPEGLALDSATNLYVADNFNHTIRKITPDGVVATLAGSPGRDGYQNGPGSTALFLQPSGIAVDKADNIYVTEWGNGLVRKVTREGVVTTFAGGGSKWERIYRDGPLGKACFLAPTGIEADEEGNLYVADQNTGFTNIGAIRKVSPTGAVTTIAILPSEPYGIARDSSGNLYVSAYGDRTVWLITPDGMVTTIAGVVGNYGFQDGVGNMAKLGGGRASIVMDSENNLYLTDGANQILRKGVSFLVPTAPVYQKVQPGTPVSLCVGSGDFAYQWLFDGEVLSGQTNPVLEIGPLVRTNSGIYSVVVRNGMSNSVMLSAAVQARFPTVLQPPQRLDSGVMRLLFQASDGGLPFDFSSVQLQWRNTLPTETDTNWNVSWASQTVTNGFVLIEDTSATAQTNRFYRVVEP